MKAVNRSCARCGHAETDHVLRTARGQGCMAAVPKGSAVPAVAGICWCDRFEPAAEKRAAAIAVREK